MNSGRTIFASGIILGIAIGFSAGHLTLWGRYSQNLTGPAQSLAESKLPQEEFQPLLSEPEFLPPELGEPLPSLTTALGIDRSVHDGSQAQSHLTAEFPTGPTVTALLDPSGTAISTEKPVVGPAVSEQDQHLLPPANILLPREEPSAIQAPDAVPLTEHDAAREQEIRELVERELKDTHPTQRDVWFDSLRDLSKEDATNVLKMWKQFGGPSQEMIPAPTLGITPLQPVDELPHLAKENSAHDDSIQQAIELLKQNIVHQRDSGYKQRIPQLRRPVTGGEFQVTSRVNLSQGILEPTDSPFDWAIEGDGFFVVSTGSEAFYTRAGHWTLDESRRIVLADSNPPLQLNVSWTVPENALSLLVGTDGLVSAVIPSTGDAAGESEVQELGRIELARFLNPNGLEAVSGSHFKETGISGKAHFGRAASGGRGSVRQGVLELSNVDAEAEYLAIEDLEMLLQE